MNKKLTGGAAAVVAAMLYGGAELMGMADRLEALEAIHPELAQEKADETAKEVKPEAAPEQAEEVKATEKPDEKPEAVSEPDTSLKAEDLAGE